MPKRDRSFVSLLAALVLAVLVVAAASRQATAAPPGAPDAAADAGEEDAAIAAAEETARLREESAALQAFGAGTLAEIRSADLFRVDLADDAAVKRRGEQLAKELRVARAKLPQRATAAATATDAGDDPDRLRIALLEARASLLALPHPERQRLLDAETAAVAEAEHERDRARADEEAARAEDARRRALEIAGSAPTKAQRELAAARADVEATRAEQVRFRTDIADRRREAAAREAKLVATEARLVASAKELGTGEPRADLLYDEVVAALVELRARSRAALDALDVLPRAPRPTLNVPPTVDAPDREERVAITGESDALRATAQSMDDELRDLTWSGLRATMATERQLNDVRIALLERVSADKREQVLGFGREGRAQLLRELDRLRLEVRWLRASGGELARAEWQRLRQPSEVGRISLELLGTVFVLWVTLFVRRRLGDALRGMNVVAARSARRWVVRNVQRTTTVLAAVGRELVTLLGVVLLPQVVRIDWRYGAWSVPYTLLLWFALYRLAVKTTYRLLASASATAPVQAKILRSVRTAMRFAFTIAVVLAGAAEVLGRGYLYTLVVRIGWLGALPIGYLLVRWWRDDIADAFLHVRPTGSLADLVRRTRTRWIGFPVTIAAFVVLLLGAIVRAGRSFVLGFEHSRKALAFFFRRRLERQGERGSDDELRLGPELLAFFTEEATEEETLLLGDRFPALDELLVAAETWRKGKGGRATLVVGRTGYGKSSWLAEARRRIEQRTGVHADVVRVVAREPSAESVVTTIAHALGRPEVATLDALVDALKTGDLRVVTVDDAHLWYLRGVGTFGAWSALRELVERTSSKVLWIVAVAHYPWEFLRWVARDDGAFRTTVRLRPWAEPEISALIERRTEASGLVVSYDALLVEDIGPVEGVDDRAKMLSTARDYNRLIWDYAEGSPRVAMHVWARSLVPDGEGRARVRLFGSPQAAWLDLLGETAKFVVAAIVWHEQLSAEEASVVLRLPPSACEDVFARLLERGAAEACDEGRTRISALWWPPVVRYLRRKHLIES